MLILFKLSIHWLCWEPSWGFLVNWHEWHLVNPLLVNLQAKCELTLLICILSINKELRSVKVDRNVIWSNPWFGQSMIRSIHILVNLGSAQNMCMGDCKMHNCYTSIHERVHRWGLLAQCNRKSKRYRWI